MSIKMPLFADNKKSTNKVRQGESVGMIYVLGGSTALAVASMGAVLMLA